LIGDRAAFRDAWREKHACQSAALVTTTKDMIMMKEVSDNDLADAMIARRA
jgi:hypothetical protein